MSPSTNMAAGPYDEDISGNKIHCPEFPFPKDLLKSLFVEDPSRDERFSRGMLIDKPLPLQQHLMRLKTVLYGFQRSLHTSLDNQRGRDYMSERDRWHSQEELVRKASGFKKCLKAIDSTEGILERRLELVFGWLCVHWMELMESRYVLGLSDPWRKTPPELVDMIYMELSGKEKERRKKRTDRVLERYDSWYRELSRARRMVLSRLL